VFLHGGVYSCLTHLALGECFHTAAFTAASHTSHCASVSYKARGAYPSGIAYTDDAAIISNNGCVFLFSFERSLTTQFFTGFISLSVRSAFSSVPDIPSPGNTCAQ